MKKEKTQRDFVSTEQVLRLVQQWNDRAAEPVDDLLDPVERAGPESPEELATRSTWGRAAAELLELTEGTDVVPAVINMREDEGSVGLLWFSPQQIFKPIRLVTSDPGFAVFWKGQAHQTPFDLPIDSPCLDIGDVFALQYWRQDAAADVQLCVTVRGKAVP